MSTEKARKKTDVFVTVVTETTRKPDEATDIADTVPLLGYLVDGLPARTDRVFAEAETGESIIHDPSTALVEVF